MLSYRHGFHAGNHADILKHMTLCLLMRSLGRKDKPMTVIDTHAGAGLYSLHSSFAQKNREFESGLSAVIDDPVLQEYVPEFYDVLSRANQRNPFRRPEIKKTEEPTTDTESTNDRLYTPAELKERLNKGSDFVYPGSPFFEFCLSRRDDSVFLSDLHTAEFESLRSIFKDKRKMHIELKDGLAGLKALLPPIKKRGLILIDPSYELKTDYRETVRAVKEGASRFNQGVFAVWYPVLSRLQDRSKNLTQELRRTGLPLLQAEIRVSAQQEEYGMCGSGMLIVNFPYRFEEEAEPVIGRLYEKLCDQDGGAVLKVLNEKE